MNLKGKIVSIDKINNKDIDEMYELMTKFYDNMEKDIFTMDFYNKDYCIILRDEKGNIWNIFWGYNNT